MGAAISSGFGLKMTTIAQYGAAADGTTFSGVMPVPCGLCLQRLAELHGLYRLVHLASNRLRPAAAGQIFADPGHSEISWKSPALPRG
jgi:cytidine deaminase